MDFTTTFGVTGMTVDLKTGTVNVTSSNELDRDAIEAAIDEAGYQYVG